MAYTFIPTGLDGAGFQNSVSVSPNGQIWLYSGDVAGVHKSTDAGRTWRQINRGLMDKPDTNGGATWFETDTIAYYVAGPGSGLWRSDDIATTHPTWVFQAAVNVRPGNYSGDGLPATHPRSTGRLMTSGGASGVASWKWLYVASFRDGVYRSGNGGATLSRIVGSASSDIFLRGIAEDKSNPNTLYVAAYNGTAGTGGLYRVINANGTATWSKMTTPFNTVEEVLTLGTLGGASRVYVVGKNGSTSGVWKATAPTGTSSGEWTNITGTIPTNAVPCSIDGYKVSGGSDVIWVGCEGGVVFSGNLKASLFRSTTAGTSWEIMPTSATSATVSPWVKETMGDAGGDDWWHYDDNPGARLGTGGQVVVSTIAISPTDPDEMVLAGRAGGWVTHDSTAASPTFYPSVHNLNVTINPRVVSDPNSPGRVAWSSVDWGVLWSTDYGATVNMRKPAGLAGAYALDVDTASTPSVYYVGGGDRDTNVAGYVGFTTNIATTAWTSLNFSAAVGGARCMGLAPRRISGTTWVLAHAVGDGIWLYNGTAWSRKKAAGTNSLSTDGTPAIKRTEVAWVNDNLAYVYEPASGLWRGTTTTSRLDTWTRVWAQTTSARGTGYMVLKPGSPGTLWLSLQAGLFRLDGADTGIVGTGATFTEIDNLSSTLGPVGLTTDSKLVIWETGAVPTFKTTSNLTSATPTWVDEANEDFRDSHQFPNDMDLRSPGLVYTAGEGTGAAMASGLLLSGVGIPINVTFGTPTVQGGQANLSPTGIPVDVTFGTPTVTGGVAAIAPSGFGIDVNFGTPTVSLGSQILVPEGFGIDIEFGTPTVRIGRGKKKPRRRADYNAPTPYVRSTGA